MTNEGNRTSFLSSLQLTDSLFPSGLYTLSHGLESYFQAELLAADSLTALIADLLRSSVGPTDATACALAMRAAKNGDLEGVGHIDERLHAVKLVREQRQASLRLGRQLLALSRDVFQDEASATYLRRVRDAGMPGHHAVASGLLKSALSISPREGVVTELYSYAASCAGAALRMAAVDHRQVQRTLHHLQPAIETVADEALRREVGELGGSAPLAEIMAMRHEVAEMRLFVT